MQRPRTDTYPSSVTDKFSEENNRSLQTMMVESLKKNRGEFVILTFNTTQFAVAKSRSPAVDPPVKDCNASIFNLRPVATSIAGNKASSTAAISMGQLIVDEGFRMHQQNLGGRCSLL